jgi:hypothetical protein
VRLLRQFWPLFQHLPQQARGCQEVQCCLCCLLNPVGKGLGGPVCISELSTGDGIRQDNLVESPPPLLLPIPSHNYLMDSLWKPCPTIPLAYCFSSTTYLNSPKHFFINVSLSFPGHKPVKTFMPVDSGVSVSCISDHFAERHLLSCCLKDVSVPVMAVDNFPVAKWPS